MVECCNDYATGPGLFVLELVWYANIISVNVLLGKHINSGVTHTHTHTHTHTLFLSLSLSHTHTHAHKYNNILEVVDLKSVTEEIYPEV
jgi:hypothetical protein